MDSVTMDWDEEEEIPTSLPSSAVEESSSPTATRATAPCHMVTRATVDDADGDRNPGVESMPLTSTSTLPPPPKMEELDEKTSSSRVQLTLKDIIPCNLRTARTFLRSRVALSVEKSALRNLLRCYGFMMYNRSEKIQTFANNATDEKVRDVGRLLGELRDMESFRATLHDQLQQTRRLVNDDVAAMLRLDGNGECDDDVPLRATNESANVGGGAAAAASETVSGKKLLSLARISLDHVLAFVRTSDHIRRAINVNEYCRRLFLHDSSQALPCVQAAWYDVGNCDFDTCISILIRDMLLSSGMETHSSLLFVLRLSLLFTFFVTQTIEVRRDAEDDAAPRSAVSVAIDRENEEVDLFADYFDRYAEVTFEKVIATTCVFMTRSFFLNVLEWPCRLLENNQKTLDLERVHAGFVHALSRSTGRPALSWLRVFAARKRGGGIPGNGSVAETTRLPFSDRASRLYVNFEVLVGMFEQMSQRIDAADLAVANRESGGAAALTSNGGTLPIRNAGADLQKQYNEYVRVMRDFAEVIADCVRTRDQGLTVREFALSRAYLRGLECDDDDEVDGFVVDVGYALTYNLASLVRHDVTGFANRFDSVNYRRGKNNDDDDDNDDTGRGRNGRETGLLVYNECQDSYGVLLAHAYSHLYRAKISIGQTKNFLQQMVVLWNDRIGIATFEQLCGVLVTIYRMFPGSGQSIEL